MGEKKEVKEEAPPKKLVFCKLCRNHERESLVTLHKEVCEFRDCKCEPCIITKKDRLRARDNTRRRRSIINETNRRKMEMERANSHPATTPSKPIKPEERLATTAKTKKTRKELTTSKSLPPVPLPKICADQPQRMDVTLETTVVSDPNPIEDTYKKQYGVYPDFMSRGMDDVRAEDFSKYINVSPLWMPTPQVYNYFHPAAAPSELRARMCEQDVIGCPWAMYYPTSRVPAHAYYNPHSAFIPFMGRFQFAKSTPPPLGHRSAHLPHLL